MDALEDSEYTCKSLGTGSDFPNTVRHEALARTVRRYGVQRCEYPGCGVKRLLSVHHVRPQSAGGSPSIHNACVLCRNHHVEADTAIIRAIEIRYLWPHLVRPFETTRSQASIERLVADAPSRTVSRTRSLRDVHTDFGYRLIRLRCCDPVSESLRLEVDRAIANAQLALAGVLTSLLPSNLV